MIIFLQRKSQSHYLNVLNVNGCDCANNEKVLAGMPPNITSEVPLFSLILLFSLFSSLSRKKTKARNLKLRCTQHALHVASFLDTNDNLVVYDSPH